MLFEAPGLSPCRNGVVGTPVWNTREEQRRLIVVRARGELECISRATYLAGSGCRTSRAASFRL